MRKHFSPPTQTRNTEFVGRVTATLALVFGLIAAWPHTLYGAAPLALAGNPSLLLGQIDPTLAIASSRILILFALLMLCVLIIVFVVVMQLTRESATRVAASESRFRAIFEGAPETIIIVDPETHQVLATNPVTTRWLGYTADEFEGMLFDDLLWYHSGPDEQFDPILRGDASFTRECQFLRADGSLLDVELTGTHSSFQGRECLLIFARDITARKQTEDELQHRLQLDKIITSLSTSLINCASDEVDHEITRALHQIGEFVSVDRSFVYLLSDDGTSVNNTHEWCTEGITTHVALRQRMLVQRFPWLMRQLRRLEHVHIPHMDDIPLEGADERVVFESVGIRSFLVVPMISNLMLVGFLGFACIREEKSWSEDSIRLLRIVGEIFVNTITRTRAEHEIRLLNRDLRRRVNELNAANHELEAFSYSVSHDLRSPLRSIDGFSHMLCEDCYDKLDAQGREYIGFIRTSCRRMAEIIDDLLNLSHVARSEMCREQVNLSKIVQEILTELRKNDPNRQVDCLIPQLLVANGDARLLRLALENLLGNAWKFTGTRAQAQIEFGVTEHQGKTAYYVRDNGVGFDPTRAGRLFRAFQRLHAGTQFPGTGIGLAIVQRIIDRHGGSVWADGAVNNGATFYFTLPS